MNPGSTLTPEHQALLLKVAADSIEHSLSHPRPLAVDPAHYPPELRAPRAVFVTLTIDGELRGCVGTLESGAPLVSNAAKYAHAAAFDDSRFSPLTRDEFPALNVKISVLSELEQIACESEEDLLPKIRPGVDGLLLDAGFYRGTLLPSVWEDIPDPREFLRRLKMKAGLSPQEWPRAIRVHRYTAECF